MSIEDVLNLDDTDKIKARKFLDMKVPVEIFHTDEIGGSWLWAIQVAGTDFWLGAYRDLDRSKKECEENELPIQRIGEPFKSYMFL